MNPHDPSDRQFHDNLRALGAEASTPAAPSDDLRGRCQAALSGAVTGSAHTGHRTMLRRPAFLSTVGIAASIALLFGIFQFSNSNGKVEAAVILQRISDQFHQNPLVEMTLKDVRIHDVFIDGRFTASNDAAVGDIQVRVEKDSQETIEADIAFGASSEEIWLLFRKLDVPDLRAQAVLAWLFAPGQEVLLKLPAEEAEQFSLDLTGVNFDGLGQVVQALIEAGDSVGATVTNQWDGTIRLEITLKDENSMEAMRILHTQLARPEWTSQFHHSKPAVQFQLGTRLSTEADAEPKEDSQQHDAKQPEGKKTRQSVAVEFKMSDHDEHEDDADSDSDDGHHALFGSTFWAVYDPAAKVVSSLGVRNIGTDTGSIQMDFRQGEIDPTLLDSSRVTNDKTRILDLGALQKMFGEHVHGEDE